MKKIVINACYGGFDLSPEGFAHYCSKLGDGETVEYSWDIARDDPRLVETVEELGLEANGSYADLKIVEIPSDVEFVIVDNHGEEYVAEKHRTWK